jgi:hypothetical protein
MPRFSFDGKVIAETGIIVESLNNNENIILITDINGEIKNSNINVNDLLLTSQLNAITSNYYSKSDIESISGNLQSQIDSISGSSNNIIISQGYGISVVEDPTGTFTISVTGEFGDATLRSEVENITGQLQSQINTKANTSDLNNYTLLTTTAELTGQLQSQIDSFNIIAGSNITVYETPENTWTISAAISGGGTDHNTLANLQGGTTSQYYHLTQSQYSNYIEKTEVENVTANFENRIIDLENNPVPDIFRSEIENISSNLQSQINTKANTSDLNNYTLLTTTESLTGNIQSQIDDLYVDLYNFDTDLQTQLINISSNFTLLSTTELLTGNLQSQINNILDQSTIIIPGYGISAIEDPSNTYTISVSGQFVDNNLRTEIETITANFDTRITDLENNQTISTGVITVSGGTITGSLFVYDGVYNTGGSWTTSIMPSGEYYGVAYGYDKFVAVGFNSATQTPIISYSQDGKFWKSATVPQQLLDNESSLYDICYGNGKFVATCSNSATENEVIIYSDDGINWTVAVTPNSTFQTETAITYGNDRFVAAAYSGDIAIMYSYDGINWTHADSVTDFGWQDLSYYNGRFFAVGDQIFGYSDNGINWVIQNSFGYEFFYILTCGNGIILATSAFSSNYTFYYSTDFGNNWNSVIIPSSPTIYDLIFANGQFIGLDSLGNTYISKDCENWTILNNIEPNSYAGMYYANGMLIAVGENSCAINGWYNGTHSGSSTTISAGSGLTIHNDLTEIQGGTSNEYYHLTNSQYSDYIGKTEVFNITGNLQSQINNKANTTDLNNYTLLTTTSTLTGNLQSQINNLNLNTLSDVNITNVTGGQILYYNGSNWQNKDLNIPGGGWAYSSIVGLSGVQTTGLALYNPIKFTNIIGNHTLNTYKIKILANQTAMLKAGVRAEYTATTGWAKFQWYDVTNAQYVGVEMHAFPPTYNYQQFTESIVVARISTTVDTEYELRITGITGAISQINAAWATAESTDANFIGRTEIANITGNFQTQINNYTLLSTTASLTANLQTQINNITASTNNHNSLLNIQGGISNQYYHLSQDQYDNFISSTTVSSLTGNLQTQIDNVTGTGATILNELTDVTISTPTSGQILYYNGSQWINNTPVTNPYGSMYLEPETVKSITVNTSGAALNIYTNVSSTYGITTSLSAGKIYFQQPGNYYVSTTQSYFMGTPGPTSDNINFRLYKNNQKTYLYNIQNAIQGKWISSSNFGIISVNANDYIETKVTSGTTTPFDLIFYSGTLNIFKV